MAEFEKVEFEFPDEVEEKQSRLGSKVVEPEEKEEKEEEPEIEIVDDTPEEDRNRVPMATPPEDPTDEELASYSKRDRVKTREFHKAYHDERRAKEAANREKDEAIRIAQAVLEENNRLKGTVNESNSALLEQAKKNVANDLNAAKARYKQAYEAGDSDQLLEAQDEMTSIKIKAERLNNFRPKPLQEPVIEVKPEFKQAPQVDPKAENWFKTNDSWWGKDREMTGFALAVHDKLVIEDGVNPQSDEYYQRLNGRLRQVFPDKFESGESGDANRRPKSNVVASATRSTAPKKIVLNASEVAIARKLNIPLERYAKEVAILRRNGNG
jgi:hypothetical protein